jgi:hypothetical protein
MYLPILSSTSFDDSVNPESLSIENNSVPSSVGSCLRKMVLGLRYESMNLRGSWS